MTVTLERDTLRISEDTLRRLKELGVSDGAELQVSLEPNRLVVYIDDPNAATEARALNELRRLRDQWRQSPSTADLVILRSDERARE